MTTQDMPEATREALWLEAQREAEEACDNIETNGGSFSNEPGMMSRAQFYNDTLRDKGFLPDGTWVGERSNITPGAIYHDDPPTDGEE